MKRYKIRIVFLASVFLSIPAYAQNGNCCDQGIPTSGRIADIDIDGDGTADILYLLTTEPDATVPNAYNVEYGLFPYAHSGLPAPSAITTFYKYGQMISSPSAGYRPGIDVTHYGAYNGPGGWQYGYANDDFAGNKFTNIYVGFVLTQSDGRHFGWLHMSRPDLKVKTPFSVVDYAYNPVPEAPIQAGIPAPPPVISTQLTPGGIQLAWPASISGWTLQTAIDLKGNAVWQDYSTGTTNLLVPLTETRRYFRLVKP